MISSVTKLQVSLKILKYLLPLIYLIYLVCSVMTAAILYHLHNLKNVRKNHTGALLLVKMPPEKCDFTKNNSRPWIFFALFNLYKWYQIAPSTIYLSNYFSRVNHQMLVIKCCTTLTVKWNKPTFQRQTRGNFIGFRLFFCTWFTAENPLLNLFPITTT